MTKKNALFVFGFGLLLLVYALSATSDAQAQKFHDAWTTPYRMSNPENTYVSGSHALISDQYGYTHIFWVETDRSQYIIYYARFDGVTWSRSVDVYLGANPITELAPAIDPQGTLHLIWAEGSNQRQYRVHHRSASVDEALSAKHWKSLTGPETEGHLIRLQVDSAGVLHLLVSRFFGAEPGIYYQRSEDGGATWSDPLWLDPDVPSAFAPGSLQFSLDEADILHIVWHYTPIDEGSGNWVRYIRSVDGGAQWSAPMVIAENGPDTGQLLHAGPILAAYKNTVMVVWAANLDGRNLRHYRVSTDAGESWSNARRIFGGLNGQAGDDLAVDGRGDIHFAGQIRYPQGIYHAYWDHNRWSEPQLLYLISRGAGDPIGSRYHAHAIRLTVRAGNQLILGFYDRSDEQPHTLYVMQRQLDGISPQPTAALATAFPATEATSEAMPTVPASGAQDPAAEPTLSGERTSPTAAANPGSDLWNALIPSALLLVVTVGLWLAKKH